ncbi:Myb-like protein I [Porphyridium purpureum]|uniref:Myb-like protein I n=1 Tax=Porphyridium purpureum TaxID=35688 RepID=A0A5J4YNP4_PORPP|nr:Myb-like protein I [Porphyridium purpureum]|eukprot:POR0069..scf296_7
MVAGDGKGVEGERNREREDAAVGRREAACEGWRDGSCAGMEAARGADDEIRALKAANAQLVRELWRLQNEIVFLHARIEQLCPQQQCVALLRHRPPPSPHSLYHHGFAYVPQLGAEPLPSAWDAQDVRSTDCQQMQLQLQLQQQEQQQSHLPLPPSPLQLGKRAHDGITAHSLHQEKHQPITQAQEEMQGSPTTPSSSAEHREEKHGEQQQGGSAKKQRLEYAPGKTGATNTKSNAKAGAGRRQSGSGSGSSNSTAPAATTAEAQGSPRYWTQMEHALFLEAIKKFGHREPQAISRYVGTRNSTQVRTHTQKYFMKLMRDAKRHAVHLAIPAEQNQGASFTLALLNRESGSACGAAAAAATAADEKDDAHSVPQACGVALLSMVAEDI